MVFPTDDSHNVFVPIEIIANDHTKDLLGVHCFKLLVSEVSKGFFLPACRIVHFLTLILEAISFVQSSIAFKLF